MKFLIVAQAIFPSQVPRSFRATELAKGLAKEGHDVTLYALTGNYDYAEFEHKFDIRVKDIGKVFFSKTNSDDTARWNFFDKGLKKALGDIIEFPDIELMFKVPRIIKNEHNTDCLITIGVPYPLHWGAALAKSLRPKAFPSTWIADCGDPYMGNAFKKHFFYFKNLETWFCRKADYLTIPIEEARKGYYDTFQQKIEVIPQGFDFDELDLPTKNPQNNIPTFAYAGIFYRKKRDPTLFLEYLSKLNKNFKFIIFTRNNDIIEPFQQKLGGKLELREYVPRNELLKILSQMDFLVNFENNSNVQSPSKLIDYSLTNRPILSVGSEFIPEETFQEFLRGDYSQQYKLRNLQQYNIKNVVAKFVELAKRNSN